MLKGNSRIRCLSAAILILGAAIASFSVAAAQTTTVQPGAIDREFDERAQPLSSGRVSVPGALLPGAPEGASETRFVLNDVIFEGGGIIPAQEMRGYASELLGREVSLAEIYEVSAKITRAYSEAGYPLSVAVIPAQEIVDGVVRIIVIEGFVSAIEITGDPGKASGFLRKHGEKLRQERPLTAASLERYLLLANDIPGLEVRAVFDQAPDVNGGVKLILDARRDRFSGDLSINNRGSIALGRPRFVAQLAENGDSYRARKNRSECRSIVRRIRTHLLFRPRRVCLEF